MVERIELQRCVSEAVLALPEPYRSVVSLRYYEDLSSAQIARRLGVPEATVRVRLMRALERLRRKLDRTFGERRAWVAPALALAGVGGPHGPGAAAARRGSASPVSGRGVTLIPKGIAWTAGVLLVAGVGALWMLRGPGSLPATPAVAPDVREEALRGPGTHRIPRSKWRASVPFARSEPAPVDATDAASAPASERERAFVFVRFETLAGGRTGPALRRAGISTFARLAAIATEEPPPREFPATDRDGPVTLGIASFHEEEAPRGPSVPPGFDGVLVFPEDGPVHVSAVLRTAVLATSYRDAGQDRITLVVPLADALASVATVRFRVLDAETLLPLPSSEVRSGNNGLLVRGMEVGDDGSFEERGLGPGLWGITVGCVGREDVMSRVRLGPGEVRDLGDVELERAWIVRARFVGPAGEAARANYHVLDLDRFDASLPVHLSGLRGSLDPRDLRAPAARHQPVRGDRPRPLASESSVPRRSGGRRRKRARLRAAGGLPRRLRAAARQRGTAGRARARCRRRAGVLRECSGRPLSPRAAAAPSG